MKDKNNGTTTCPQTNAKWYHGPNFTKAMWNKFREESAKPAEDAVEAPAAEVADQVQPEAKAKAKSILKKKADE